MIIKDLELIPRKYLYRLLDVIERIESEKELEIIIFTTSDEVLSYAQGKNIPIQVMK